MITVDRCTKLLGNDRLESYNGVILYYISSDKLRVESIFCTEIVFVDNLPMATNGAIEYIKIDLKNAFETRGDAYMEFSEMNKTMEHIDHKNSAGVCMAVGDEIMQSKCFSYKADNYGTCKFQTVMQFGQCERDK